MLRARAIRSGSTTAYTLDAIHYDTDVCVFSGLRCHTLCLVFSTVTPLYAGMFAPQRVVCRWRDSYRMMRSVFSNQSLHDVVQDGARHEGKGT